MSNGGIPQDCIDCSMRRLKCDRLKPSCSRCASGGGGTLPCSYDWTVGLHIFDRFGPTSDVTASLERIHRPYDAKAGAYGRVYRVPRKSYAGTEEQQVVMAVKVLHNYKFHPSRTLEIGLREAWTWVQLDHPNIAKFIGLADYQHLASGGSAELCLVSQWAKYGNIEEYISAHEVKEIETLALLHDIASGVDYLHTNMPHPIIHGDLKANNVLVFCDPSVLGGRPRAALVDFGISLIWHEGESRIDTTTTVTGGNPRWMAWERLDPKRHGFNHTVLSCTTHSDVFEMMRTFLQILTKKPPYHTMSDAEFLRKAARESSPERPTEGWLSRENGLWNLLSWGWSRLKRDRPSASEVCLLLECHITSRSWELNLLDSAPEVRFSTAVSHFRHLCERHGLHRPEFFEPNETVSASSADTEVLWRIKEQSLPSIFSLIQVQPWTGFSLRVGSLEKALRVLTACSAQAAELTDLDVVVEDVVYQGYPEWPCPTEIPTGLAPNHRPFSGTLPDLETLRFDVLPLAWCSGVYARLTELDIRHQPRSLRPTRSEWRNLLRQVPLLESLIVINSGPAIRKEEASLTDTFEEDIVHLPELCHVGFGCLDPPVLYYMLFTIQAPTLKSLAFLRLYGEDYTAALELVEHNRFPRLDELDVCYVSWPNELFLRLVFRLEKIAHLSLWCGDGFLETITKAYNHLGPEDPRPLPGLQRIQGNGCMCTALQEFYHARAGLGLKLKEIRRYHISDRGSHCKAVARELKKAGCYFSRTTSHTHWHDLKDEIKDVDPSVYAAKPAGQAASSRQGR